MPASTSSPGGFGENPFPKLCRCLTLPSPGCRLASRITRRLLHGFSGQRLDLAVDQPESAASLPASCSCNESTSTPSSLAIIGAPLPSAARVGGYGAIVVISALPFE